MARMRRSSLLALALIAGIAGHGVAATISLSALNIFRDDRGENDVGIAQGDVFQFGADIAGGSSSTTIAGSFTPAGSLTPTLVQTASPCSPLTTNANFCARSSSFNTAELNGTWQVNFAQAGVSTVATLPSVAVIPTSPVPFPSSVTITPGGTTPTISWTLPAGTSPNAFRVNIYDRSTPVLANGQHDIISTSDLSPSATSFTIPASAGIMPGSNYTINFQVIDTRNGSALPQGASNANILTRSSSFFDFSPPAAGSPPVIALPTVNGVTGVYTFDVGSVGPSSTTFIDPSVAIGYEYAVGSGDPNFASVLLPNVGGGVFTLSYLGLSTVLDAGVQFFFPSGGVSAFNVTGIDPSAGLDPADTLAFITGLTFVSDGEFTGTMTPITTEVGVPEPATAALLGMGCVLLGSLRRRSRPR